MPNLLTGGKSTKMAGLLLERRPSSYGNAWRSLQRGNLAIASHAADGKSLLLFRKTREGLRLVGEMVYEKHHIERAPDRDGNERDAVVFELRALSAFVETTEETPESEPPRTLEQLRELAKRRPEFFLLPKLLPFGTFISAAATSVTTSWLTPPDIVGVARLLPHS
jgi:hypothetical protein